MQIAGDARTFRFERMLAFRALALASFVLQLGSSLDDPTLQQRDPDGRQDECYGQQADHREQALQRPPRRRGKHDDVRGPVDEQFKIAHLTRRRAGMRLRDIDASQGQFAAGTQRERRAGAGHAGDEQMRLGLDLQNQRLPFEMLSHQISLETHPR